MNLPRLHYSITRPFTIPYYTEFVLFFGLLWVGLVTLFNVAAVGYDIVQVFSTSFEPPTQLWYEKFSLTKELFPSSWTCTPALIEPYQSQLLHSPFILTLAIYTSMGFAVYNIVTTVDPRTNAPISGLLYGNYPLQNCSVLSIVINVPNVDTPPAMTVLPHPIFMLMLRLKLRVTRLWDSSLLPKPRQDSFKLDRLPRFL
jgi:hypothetical protein